MSASKDGIGIYYIGSSELDKIGWYSRTCVKQFYSKIIKEHSASNPFEDPEFPRTLDSVGKVDLDSAQGESVSYPDWDRTFDWKRVKDLVPKGTQVTFFGPTGEDRLSRFDLSQGAVGDCWFLAAVAEITQHEKIINFIVPEDNANNNDSGAYHFRIRLHGCCVDVVVDDWLPCCEFEGPGNGWTPLGVRPVIKDGRARMWAALIEKAYAKLNGSYAITENNYPRYAFEDLTGGLGLYRQISLPQFKEEALSDKCWNDILGFYHSGACFVSWWTGSEPIPEDGYKGLHALHAYTMTGLENVHNDVTKKDVRLVRLRNPWGRGEWEGDWSDSSKMWDQVSSAKRAELKLVNREDGEFWIEYEVLLKWFYQVDYCIGIPSGLVSKIGEKGRTLEKREEHGRWSIANKTAGGCLDFSKNPQYLIRVGNPDDAEVKDCLLAVSIQVTQLLKGEEGRSYGYRIYWVSDPTNTKWPLIDVGDSKFGNHYSPEFFAAPENKVVASSASIEHKSEDEFLGYFGRAAADHYTVPAGSYLFVPVLQEADEECDYHFRAWYDGWSDPGTIVVGYESEIIDLTDPDEQL